MLPQFTPVGLDVTVPAPVPALVTVNANVVAELLNVAVTERAAVIDTVQVLVPVHAPLQPANVEPVAAARRQRHRRAAGSTTLHMCSPQFTPDGDDVTVPLPAPALVTDNAKLLVPDGTNGDRNCPPITACGDSRALP